MEQTVKRQAAPEQYVARIMANGPQLPPSPPASVTHGDDDDDDANDEIIYTEPIPQPPLRLQRSSTEVRPPRSTGPPPNSTTAHLSADGYLQPPPPSIHRERPARRNTIGSVPKPPPPPSIGELEEDIQLHAEHIRRERLSKRAKLQAEAEAALTRGEQEAEDVPLVGNLIGEGHVNYVLMYNMLTGIRIGVSRCQAKIKRPLTPDDFKAAHKFSFDVIGNELTPSAKYDFKFKDYAPWIFRSLREDFFHLDPADYLLSLTSKYILSELGSPGKSGSFFYFSRDYRFIIKTIHHAEHAYLLKILPQYYAHVQANPHTLLSRFYGLHRVKLPRGRKIHFVIMNNIFPPHRDIHETYDLKGSTVGREYSEEKARENPRAVLKDLNWINRGRTLELGPEKRALLAEQLRRDAAFLKTIHVMDYSLLVGIHNMRRGNRDNVRRSTLKVFTGPQIAHARSKKTFHHHPHLHHPHTHSSGMQQQGSPEAVAMRRALYRTSGPERRLDDVQLPDADDPGLVATASPEPELPEVDLHRPGSGSSSSQASSRHQYHQQQLQHHQQQQQAQIPSFPPPPSSYTAPSNQHPHQHPHRTSREKGKDREREKDLSEHFTDRQHFVFYQDEGGLRATDEANLDMDTIYYVGVIDILTPWRGVKKLERFWKGLSADRHKISPVPPGEYAERFLAFVKAVVRGGEGGGRFKAE